MDISLDTKIFFTKGEYAKCLQKNGKTKSDGETQPTDSVEAKLDNNPKFTRADLAAEQGGARGDDNDGDEPKSEQSENKDKESSDLEAEILGVLEAEGGAAGMEALEKELDASKDQIRKEIEDSDKMEKHRDGDIIDITGLEGHDAEDKDEDDDEEETKTFMKAGDSP